MAVSALVLVVVAEILSAVLDRSAWRTYAALFTSVAAAYLTLFELGRGRPGHVSSLGVLASLLAIAFWGIERATSRLLRGEWLPIFRTPTLHAAISLAVLAILPEWDSPRALLLASLPFLLLIKSVPRPFWLYPALGLVAASVAFAAYSRWGEGGVMASAVVAGFAAWGIGWVLERWTAQICKVVRLPIGFRYERPSYHWAIALGLSALGVCLDRVIDHNIPIASQAWVPAVVGVLSLLMLRPFPGRWWVDGFIGLASVSGLASVAPQWAQPMTVGLVLLTLALVWRMAQWGALPVESAAARRLGIGFDGFAEVLGQWALGLLAIGVIPLVLRLGVTVPAATWGTLDSLPVTTSLEWWSGLVAILLLGANLDLARRTSPFPVTIGLHATATMLLWWLAAPASPLMARLHLDASIVLPLVTAGQALISALIAARSGSMPMSRFSSGLALVPVALTAGRPILATTATLAMASCATGVLARSLRCRKLAGQTSLLVMLTFAYASWNISQRFGWDRSSVAVSAFAVGQALSSLGLIAVGRWDRRRGFGLASIVERFALGGLALASLGVAFPTILAFGSVGSTQSLIDMGVMFAVGAMCVIVASRWASIALAFAAQASILVGYAAFRAGIAIPEGGDSTAMLILSGLNLGVAEIAGRGGRRLFALPAMATGLVLPMLSVGLAMRNGPVGEESLFVLLAAGTFYAATTARLGWKPLGYASAVFYNVALWVLWSRFGWKLASDPHLFLVPVGFTTILFAETNRKELGRRAVNAIRGVGLTLIYASLAFPIWQTSSFAAWAAILGVSLLGIFAGIGLRSQTFLWFGLAGLVLDVVYQLGRVGMEHALAKWAIMLALGLGLVVFVALNEKKKLMSLMRKYVDIVRGWD